MPLPQRRMACADSAACCVKVFTVWLGQGWPVPHGSEFRGAFRGA